MAGPKIMNVFQAQEACGSISLPSVIMTLKKKSSQK